MEMKRQDMNHWVEIVHFIETILKESEVILSRESETYNYECPTYGFLEGAQPDF